MFDTSSLAIRPAPGMETHALVPGSDFPLVHAQRVDLSCQVALTTLIIYNATTKLDKEIKYIWSKPCSLISIVYLTNQYLGIFSMVMSLWQFVYVDKTLCTFALISSFLAEWLVLLEIDYILLLRVTAIFSQGCRAVKWLKLFLAVQAILVLVAVVYPFCIHHIEHTGLGFCEIESGISPLFQSFRCMGPFAFELVLVSLVVYKSIEFGKDAEGLRGFRLMKVLMHDQVVFFAWISCCFFTHILSLLIDPTGTTNVPLSIVGQMLHGSTLPCIIGSWLIIHLKEVAEKNSIYVIDDDGMEIPDVLSGSRALSSIQFA